MIVLLLVLLLLEPEDYVTRVELLPPRAVLPTDLVTRPKAGLPAS